MDKNCHTPDLVQTFSTQKKTLALPITCMPVALNSICWQRSQQNKHVKMLIHRDDVTRVTTFYGSIHQAHHYIVKLEKIMHLLIICSEYYSMTSIKIDSNLKKSKNSHLKSTHLNGFGFKTCINGTKHISNITTLFDDIRKRVQRNTSGLKI